MNAPDSDRSQEQPTGFASGATAWLLVSREPETSTVSLRMIISTLWRQRVWVLGAAFLFAALGATYALVTPKTYEASLIVTIVDETGLVGARSSLGNLASLAGINLDRGGRRAEYVAMLSSKLVVGRFIEKHNLLPVLFAKRWDESKKQWKESWLSSKPPTLNDAMRVFTTRILEIREDRTNNLVRVKVHWKDPEVAAQWANGLVDEVNEQVRRETREEASRGVDFLNSELDKTSSIQIRESIFRLMEGNLNKIMLANVQRQYALKTIDPAIADPRKVVHPRLVFTTALAFLVGAFLGSLIGLWRSSLVRTRQT